MDCARVPTSDDNRLPPAKRIKRQQGPMYVDLTKDEDIELAAVGSRSA